MHSVRGKPCARIIAAALGPRLAAYHEMLIDIGTGDGRYVQHMALSQPDCFAIGIDACEENLRQRSRRAPRNALYLVADALALPSAFASALAARATHITINFPWGSLLAGLLEGRASLGDGLVALARRGALLEVRLNGGALAEAGLSLDAGGARVRQALRAWGFAMRPPTLLGVEALRACPTTWAHRLAFGRDPRALYLAGVAIDSGAMDSTTG